MVCTRTPWLWWVAIACLAASIGSLVMMRIDPTQLNGINIWIKPWKFQISVAIHLLTLGFFGVLLAQSTVNARRLQTISIVAVVSSVFELSYISLQAARGQASHFNNSSTIAEVMYALMGIGAVSLTACAGVLGWWILRERAAGSIDLARTAIGWGLIIGCVLGTASGAYVGGQTSHWVGGTLSDAGSLPVVGWSRDGGDLRVAHFFGLHAMQLLALLAWPIYKLSGATRTAVNAWWACAALYSGWSAYTFIQAINGLPLLS